jgi:hypothetical protein
MKMKKQIIITMNNELNSFKNNIYSLDQSNSKDVKETDVNVEMFSINIEEYINNKNL